MSQELLVEAREKARRYDWTEAADSYERALAGLDPEANSQSAAEVLEMMVNARFKASFQAENRDEFKRRMGLAETVYSRLTEFYRKTGQTGLESRAAARRTFASYWIEDKLPERRITIERAISQANETSQRLSAPADKIALAETRRDLLTYFLEAEFNDTSWESRRERFERVLEIGEQAVEQFEELGDGYEESLVECLSITLDFLAWLPYQVMEPSRFPEFAAKASNLQGRLAAVSKGLSTKYTRCLAQKDFGTLTFLGMIEGDHSNGFAACRASVMDARATRDSYLIGWVCSRAVTHALWHGIKKQEAEQRREILEEGAAFGSEGIRSLEVPLEFGLLVWNHDFLADCYIGLANDVETDVEKKQILLRTAIAIAKKGMAYDPFPDSSHTLSKAMQYLASIESSPQEKSRLLNEAMHIRANSVRVNDQVLGPYGRGRGVFRNYLALIKIELAKTETDPSMKHELLTSASTDMRECLDIVSNWGTTSFFVDTIAEFEERYGDILFELHSYPNAVPLLREAIKQYEDSAAHRRKAGISPSALVLWKLAKAYQASGDKRSASLTFRAAADEYRLAAKKILGSAPAFEGLASYMDSWSWIEEARLYHNNEQYAKAAESYSKASSVLRQTRDYGPLSTHYAACEMLELGEASSREERPEEAGEHFRSAVRSFDEARLEIERRLKHAQRQDDRKELEDWVATTLGRERYSGGRAKLENAKVLDKRGDKEASSTEYYTASEVFGALAKATQTDQARQELDTLRLFSEAWSKLKEAEVKAAPEAYREAAELFLTTEKTAAKEKMQLLARANASICRALASGTMFRRTRDTALYPEIKKQLETAADYYQEGDFENAAEWTRATGRMFDALVYLADAESEKELKRKTELFHLAEKHLELAARLYGQAGFSKKREEALKHLEKAREEKELLLTPLDALSAPPSSYSTVMPASLGRDQSSGLERYESAHVVGNLGIAEKEVGVGAVLLVELEMANVGKTPAMLIRLENISPSGFELDRQRVTERVEDGVLDLRSTRLEYLKTHEIKVSLKATRKGTFELHPRIVFVDERGNHGSYEFGPAHVSVREMGLVGWVKGPK